MGLRWLSTWWWRIGDSPAARILVQRLTALSHRRRRGHRVDACGLDVDRPVRRLSWTALL